MIRSIEYTIDTENKMSLPRQWAGMQYEDNVTQVSFNVGNRFENALYRIDFNSSLAGYNPSDNIVPVDGVISRSIPLSVTQYGGEIQVTLVITLLDKGGNETGVCYSYPAIVYFTDVEKDSIGEEHICENISIMEQELKKKQEEILEAASKSVGKASPDNETGEIFNDYENNKALAAYSSVKGKNNIAGARALKIIHYSPSLNQFITDYVDTDETLDIQVGDKFSVHMHTTYGHAYYEYFGTITEVQPMRKPDKQWNYRIVVDNTHSDWIFPITDETLPPPYFKLPEKPQVGDPNFVLGVGSEVCGRDNIGGHDCVTVTGYENIAEGYCADVGGRGNVGTHFSFVRGKDNTAYGTISDVGGQENQVSVNANRSFIRGQNNAIYGGTGNAVFGNWNRVASGNNGLTTGNSNMIKASNAIVGGSYNEVTKDDSLHIGYYGAHPEALIDVGRGDANARKSAFWVSDDGHGHIWGAAEESDGVPQYWQVKAVEENVNTSLTNQANEAKNIFANALKGIKSGSAFLCDDVSPIEHSFSIKLSSNTLTDFSSVKFSVLGKNLFWYNRRKPTTTKINGVTFTVNEDGTVTANGTATEDAAFSIYTGYDSLSGEYKAYPHLRNKTFILSGCPSGGSSTTYRLVQQNYGYTDYGGGVTYTPDIYNIDFNIIISKGYTADNLVFKPLLRYSGGDKTYEPYIAPVEYPVNADGVVDGVTSLYPNMSLITDTAGVTIDCEYNRDINAAFAKLEAAIASL